jgi:dipeptidyl-peptidase-4
MANAKVRLGIVAASGGEPTWLDWGNDDTYLARVDWLPDGSLGVQIENREQSMLELVRFDVRTGERVTLLRETSDVWINLHHMFKPLQQGSFVWASERSGFRHLYLYDAEGTLVRQLTAGEWMVDEIAGVDEQHGQVYFLATKDGPTERQLYRVSLAGGEPQRITMEPGSHTVVLDHAFERFVDVHHSTAKPPTITLRSLHDGIPLSLIYDEIDPRIAELELQPPELVELQSRDGIPLYGALYRPPAAFGAGPHPTIVLVYGGPHVQLVADSWLLTVAMRAQYLRSLGFAIFILDNRGSARRGLAFEGAIKHNMGQIEVEDQVDGVGWLVGQGITDRSESESTVGATVATWRRCV